MSLRHAAVPVASIVECMATSNPLNTSVAKPNTGTEA